MFLLAYIIFFLNIVFILRVLSGICLDESNDKTDDIVRDFIGEEEEPETYEDFGHEVPQNDSHEE
jgi:hypothetical protein